MGGCSRIQSKMESVLSEYGIMRKVCVFILKVVREINADEKASAGIFLQVI